MGSEAKRRQEAKQRVWRWNLTLGERIEIWRLLLGRDPDSEEIDELNTRAIEALEADDEFEPPPHLKVDERKEWHEAFNARIVSGDRDELAVTLEDLEQIRAAIREAISANKKDEKGEKGAQKKRGDWDGAKGYRLRHVKRAVKAAIDGDSIEGMIWPAPAPESKARTGADNGKPAPRRRAKRPKSGSEAATE
jgi:hypothetical protein